MEDKKSENINALDELHKGACMGKDAISFVLDKIEDKNFKCELKREYDDYAKIAKRIEEIYPKYDEGNPHETSIMNKAMTWYGIEMKTLLDESNSKIAELLINGVNMGIIEGRKIINNKKMDNEVHEIASTYVAMQEKSVEHLKDYL